MRSLGIVALIAAVALCACHTIPTGASMDRAYAQRLSDAFMADLIANHADLAWNKMEPELVKAMGPIQGEAAIRGLFDYCGRPLEFELRHEEIGTFFYPDGRKNPMRAFYYSGKTDQHSKGFCFFAVRIVPSAGGMAVVNFGPLKLINGELPDWAR